MDGFTASLGPNTETHDPHLKQAIKTTKKTVKIPPIFPLEVKPVQKTSNKNKTIY